MERVELVSQPKHTCCAPHMHYAPYALLAVYARDTLGASWQWLVAPCPHGNSCPPTKAQLFQDFCELLLTDLSRPCLQKHLNPHASHDEVSNETDTTRGQGAENIDCPWNHFLKAPSRIWLENRCASRTCFESTRSTSVLVTFQNSANHHGISNMVHHHRVPHLAYSTGAR